MRDERQRRAQPRRPLRRVTDRVEDLVAWALTALALFVAVAAVLTAAGLYGEGMRRVEVETGERTQVRAVLLQAAPFALVSGDTGHDVRSLPHMVPARYTTPDGTERQADVRVVGGLPAGAAVPIWVDRAGAITGPPFRVLDAVGRAAAGGGGILAVGTVVLGILWQGVRQVILRMDMARWQREWEQVEPEWSGRTR